LIEGAKRVGVDISDDNKENANVKANGNVNGNQQQQILPLQTKIMQQPKNEVVWDEFGGRYLDKGYVWNTVTGAPPKRLENLYFSKHIGTICNSVSTWTAGQKGLVTVCQAVTRTEDGLNQVRLTLNEGKHTHGNHLIVMKGIGYLQHRNVIEVFDLDTTGRWDKCEINRNKISVALALCKKEKRVQVQLQLLQTNKCYPWIVEYAKGDAVVAKFNLLRRKDTDWAGFDEWALTTKPKRAVHPKLDPALKTNEENKNDD